MGKGIRLAPDPSVGVHDLCRVLHELTERQGCKDVAKILHSSVKMTWKTAADGAWLGGDAVSDLYSSLFSIHSNGVLSSKKLKAALLKLQQEKGRLNFGKLHDSDWADAMDEQMRIGAAQFRELRRDTVKYNRCIKKCSPLEKRNIDQVLGHLTLQEEPEKGASFESSEAAADNSPPPTISCHNEAEAEEVVQGLQIFTRVLQKKTSDPSSPNFKKEMQVVGGQGEGHASSSRLQQTMPLGEQGQGSQASSSSWKYPSFDDLNLDEDEAAELRAWMLEGTSDLPKRRKAKKMRKPAAAPSKKAKTKNAKVLKSKQATYKSSFLQRATSSAYHKAKLRALKSGQDEESAKELGKAASAKVRQDVKDGVLKEE